MKNLKKVLMAAAFGILATGANAGVIDFIDLTENSTSGLGESAWNPLSLTVDGVTVTITGHATNDNPGDDTQFAYLDWGNAGLGVCKDASSVGSTNKGSRSNLCAPGSDDNVTVDEYLSFVFDQDVVIDNFWFNNNHDGKFDTNDQVTIDSMDYVVKTGYAINGINGIGSFAVTAGTAIDVAYKNEEFYISGMQVSAVPEPGSIALISLGLIGLRAARKSNRP